MQTQPKESRRKQLYGLLGDLPDRSRKVGAVKVFQQETPSYVLEELSLDLNGMEEVPAYFVRPLADDGKPRPTILYNHGHGGNYDMGKTELIDGRNSLQCPPYAEFLTGMGYNALCIDMWAFGKRKSRGTESEIFKELLWNGMVLWGMMVYDSIKAVDYLISRPDVDAERLGTTGISMGSTMAWWVAALDLRIKVCIDMCCLTDYRSMLEQKLLDCHGLYYYVPSLIKHFTTAQINGLIAPRAHLSLAGSLDRLTPVDGLSRIDTELRDTYADEGASDAWSLLVYDSGHRETPEMRKEIEAWFERWM